MEDNDAHGWDQIDKLLAGELSAAEQARLLSQVAADEALQQRLAVARALQQRGQQQQQAAREAFGRRQRRAARWRFSAATAIVLVLAAGFWWWQAGRHFFTQEEGTDWLNAAIQAERDSGYLLVAGSADWRAALLMAVDTDTPAYYDTAARALMAVLPARACEREQLQYYAGLINLLHHRSYKQAAQQLVCAERLGFGAERPGFARWLLLACISARDADKALNYAAAYPEDTAALPPAALRQLEAWRQRHQ